MDGKSATASLWNDFTAEVVEIRSEETPIGEHYRGGWHGFQLRVQDQEGRILHTAKIETWGYPRQVAMEASPDRKALAVTADGNDGYEQEDNTIAVFQIGSGGAILELYSERRECGRIYIDRPTVSWVGDRQVVIKWDTRAAATEADTVVIDRI